MKKIQVLDCTLRDGGYCNDWHFGFENSKQIISGLIESGVEIIECGFITNAADDNLHVTKFKNVPDIAQYLPNKKSKIFVAMINYGEFDVDLLPPYDGSSIDGIRVAFHKKNISNALELCSKISAKGYLVFVQPMVSLSYSDDEFLQLINQVNALSPYAFYIVDSFGMMKPNDLSRLYYIVEHNLNDGIWIGFHSHNNMQLAYSNALTLVQSFSRRNLIIDSSIMGMGRGAGNLNTELFIGFLNEVIDERYNIKPLLFIIDYILSNFYKQNYWGYSLPNYISALHNAHPNYAIYLDMKKTLTFDDMNEIFNMMDDDDKKINFNKNYIEGLYLSYQDKDRVKEAHLLEFKDKIQGKSVLIIGSGASSMNEKSKIISYSNNTNVLTISVNREYDSAITDFIFASNLRKFRDISNSCRSKTIVTSNISANDVYLQIKYNEFLNSVELVKDNATLMLINFLIKLGVKKVFLAGVDGYSTNKDNLFSYNNIEYSNSESIAFEMNKAVTMALKQLQNEIDIEFITTPQNIIL